MQVSSLEHLVPQQPQNYRILDLSGEQGGDDMHNLRKEGEKVHCIYNHTIVAQLLLYMICLPQVFLHQGHLMTSGEFDQSDQHSTFTLESDLLQSVAQECGLAEDNVKEVVLVQEGIQRLHSLHTMVFTCQPSHNCLHVSLHTIVYMWRCPAEVTSEWLRRPFDQLAFFQALIVRILPYHLLSPLSPLSPVSPLSHLAFVA